MPVQPVSIHHMLLFILKSVFTGETETCFNTSHVTLYLNTTVVYADIGGFQYITCYSLSSRQRTRFLVWSVSIHHMLLFIGSGKSLHCAKMMFQYITCYSLSTNLQESTASIYRFNTSHVTLYRKTRCRNSSRKSCFNTSHVTLYPYKELREAIIAGFQYITCYSLSEIGHSCINGVFLFQYITCYSLSRYRACCVSPFFSFNTSHVTLYPASVAHAWPSAVFQYITCYSLSEFFVVHGWIAFLFQYITCYSLSPLLSRLTAFCFVSIHHMLLFIGFGFFFILGITLFQYITCYSLSIISHEGRKILVMFQYITCYSLSRI